MTDLTECKSCGYKLRKNSNRNMKEIIIKINTVEDKNWNKLFYFKRIVLCNICITTLQMYINDFFSGEMQ